MVHTCSNRIYPEQLRDEIWWVVPDKESIIYRGIAYGSLQYKWMITKENRVELEVERPS